MGTNNIIFLENIEWVDTTGKEMVHRIPEEQSGEIKFGAQLTVRENQVGVFFYEERTPDSFRNVSTSAANRSRLGGQSLWPQA